MRARSPSCGGASPRMCQARTSRSGHPLRRLGLQPAGHALRPAGAAAGLGDLRQRSAISLPRRPFREPERRRLRRCLLDYRLPERAHLAMRAEAQALLEKTGFLLTLGGDHSITFPLLQAHVAKHGKLSLVHFDAHQDTWPLATDTHGRPRVDHGSFLSAALREELIDPATSIQIGIRTHAPETAASRSSTATRSRTSLRPRSPSASSSARPAPGATSPSTSTASTSPSRRAPGRRSRAARAAPRCSPSCIV